MDNYEKVAKSLASQLGTDTESQLVNVIEACDKLFKIYNDAKIVAKKTGISKKLVERYVKYARLPSLVQDNLGAIAKNPKTAVNLAVEAADALAWSKDSKIPVEKVLSLAKKMGEKKKKSQEEYKKLKQAAEENPESSLEAIESESKKIKNPKSYKIILSALTSDKLETVANEHGNDPEDELTEIIEWGLVRREGNS